MDTRECYRKINRVLADFEKARHGEKKISVTELARKIASPRGHGGSWENGYKAHEKVWGDPLEVCNREEYWTPLPIAYNFKGVWIFGVIDFVRFVDRVPVEVVELKYYTEPDKYSMVQAAVYGWLILKVFKVKPKIWLLLGWDGRNFKKRISVEIDVDKLIGKIIS